jgi:hypothetical protein
MNARAIARTIPVPAGVNDRRGRFIDRLGGASDVLLRNHGLISDDPRFHDDIGRGRSLGFYDQSLDIIGVQNDKRKGDAGGDA